MTDLLLGATDDDAGGAVGQSGWRPDRILSRKNVNLIATAAAAAGVVLIGLNLFVAKPSAGVEPPSFETSGNLASAGYETASPAPIVAAPAPAIATPLPATPSTETRSYALALPDLLGIPPDAAPGTVLELWVTWGEDGDQRLNRFVKRAILERIVPPLVEGAPPTLMLEVPKKNVPDLMWADRYGHLSAVTLPHG